MKTTRRKKLEPMSIRLDEDVRKRLEEAARASDRTMSNYINHVLREHFSVIDEVSGGRASSNASRSPKFDR